MTIFKIEHKQTKTCIKVFGLTIFKIKKKRSKVVYALFGFLPIWVKNVVSCFFFNAVPNFGDRLNVNVFDFFEKQVVPCSAENAEIVLIGSVLQDLFGKTKVNTKKSTIIYGCGFMVDISTKLTPVCSLDVRAVRGYKTLEKLKSFKDKNINISKNVVVGDPGLLSRYLVDLTNVKKKYDLGIIPHYVDKNSPLLSNIKVKNSIIIDVQQRPEDFLQQMAACKNIISSAMHGLIAADSLNIPNVRMVLSDKIVGGDYKFDDYYSVFGIDNHKKIDLSNIVFTEQDLLNIADEYKIENSKVQEICDNLIKHFPYSK